MAQEAPPAQQVQTCSICQIKFTSRNRLFDHLRTDHAEEWNAMSKSGGSMPAKRFRSKVAIRFGYDAQLIKMNSDQTSGEEEGANTIAAGIVQSAFVNSLPRHLSGGSAIANSIRIHNISLASEAKERPYFMAQDTDCSAASDVMVLDYSYETCGRKPLRLDLVALGDSINDHLLTNLNLGAAAKVLSITEPVLKAKLHAERSATQRTYHYLLPMSWLDGGREAIEWYVRTGKVRVEQCDAFSGQTDTCSASVSEEAPPVIARLKNALKSLESPMRTNQSNYSNVDVSTRGRFGALGQRQPQSFHNYLPDHARMLRRQMDGPFGTIDRAKVVDLLPLDSAQAGGSFDVIAVTEFRGDNFLQGQIRRHVSEVIAVVNGYVLSDFHQNAVSPGCEDVIPMAPPDRLYTVETKYHFYEQAFGTLFSSNDADFQKEWTSALFARILNRLETKSKAEMEHGWLRTLRLDSTSTLQMNSKPCTDQDERQSNLPCSPIAAKSNNLDIIPTDTPSEYLAVLSMLRDLVANKQWPPTSLARTRTMRSPQGSDNKATRGVGRGKKTSAYSGQKYHFGTFVLAREGSAHAQLANAIFELEKTLIQQHGFDRSPSTHCSVSHNVEFTPSCEKGSASASLVVGLGEFAGGEVNVGNDTFDVRYKPQQFSGQNKMVSTAPFHGERFELCWFSLNPAKADDHRIKSPGMRPEDEIARCLAITNDSLLPKFKPMKFRRRSTDALVVNEIFGDKEYERHEAGFDFIIKGHDFVLDIGAHIGVFTRYALCNGATHIIACEPEPTNAELLRYNTSCTSGVQRIEVCECAVAHGKKGTAKLIGGKGRIDGVSNTWRHSLDICSTVDATLSDGEANEVEVVPFFNGALREGITFVKIDSEGSEMDILLSPEAGIASSWLDVTHVVFEYSLTKERRVSRFHRAMANLQKAGFRLRYEGMGAWWDTELGAIWPYHNDLVVFAMKDENCGSES